ncbi:MAG: GFA family protein [Caulobacterales bacterium]
MSETVRIARCCCGEASITVAGEPIFNAICHCGSCRRRTGTAFGWSVYFPDAAIVERAGEASVYAKGGDAPFERSFCVRCGTTLYWKSATFLAECTGIAGGCFDDPPAPEPALSASETQRRHWICLPDAWLKTP